ncbi:MAG: hypothetical protein ACXVH6_05865, partial [Halobacteriota archaeon]
QQGERYDARSLKTVQNNTLWPKLCRSWRPSVLSCGFFGPNFNLFRRAAQAMQIDLGIQTRPPHP